MQRFIFNRNRTWWTCFLAQQTCLTLEIILCFQSFFSYELNQASAAWRQLRLLIGIESGYFWTEEMTKRQPQAFKDTTHTLHLNFLLATHFEALFFYFFTKLENTFDQCFWPGRTTRDVHIYRNNRIHPLDSIVTIVEFATGIGTLSHAQHPLRLRHLLPEQAQARPHFHRDSSRHYHQVGLSGARAEDFRAEARQVIVRLR